MKREYIEDRAAARIELENEAINEAFDARVNDLMQGHRFFAQFIRDSSGEEWLDVIAGGDVHKNPVSIGKAIIEMRIAQREYAEQCIKEAE